MQDIKERVERKDSNANKRICFDFRATALRPRLHTEGFPLCPHRTFHKGTSIEELQLQSGVHNSTLSNTNLYIRGGHLAKHKAKKNTTW